MKIIHNIYNDLISVENLFLAWCSFKLGKSNKKEIIKFEHNLENNLFLIRDQLKNNYYRHGKYKCFQVCDTKKRIIHKAIVRDRIIHTLIARELEEIYDKVFIAHSYSCRKNKGTHRAVKDLMSFCQKVSINNLNNFYYLKCDIKKFFDNIDHSILLKIINQKIRDERFIFLIEEILNSFYVKDVNKGIPLGNFTSQWFANIYLNEFDYFIKHKLKIKYYMRYADDFVVLHKDRRYLLDIYQLIIDFLEKKLRLCVHKYKITLKKFTSGIDWLGYKILPKYAILKVDNIYKIQRKIANKYNAFVNNEIGIWDYYFSLNSYLAHLSHCNSHNLSNKFIYN